MKRLSAKEFRTKVKHLGRTWYYEKGDVLYTNWTGAGVEFMFTGKLITAEFVADFGIEIDGNPWDENAPKRENWPYFAVIIDDADSPERTFIIDKPCQSALIAEFEKEETHKITIRKITENYKTYGGIKSFSLEGEITEPKDSEKPLIEFIGDSITCGFGVGTNERDRAFYTSDENGLWAHPYLASKMLNMELSQVCVSGICSFHCKGLPNEYGMDELFTYTDRPIQRKLGFEERGESLSKWDFKGHPADYVVINLGTNDASNLLWVEDKAAETEAFIKGYRNLVDMVRKAYGPDTVIVCALGCLIYYFYKEICDIVDDVKRENGDENIYVYRYGMVHPFEGFGGVGHPSRKTQERLAKEISEFIGGLK